MTSVGCSVQHCCKLSLVYTSVQQLLSSHVQYDCLSIDSEEQLEDAVKNTSYPPTIECIVRYSKELKRTGRCTRVGLHVSGMDSKMTFSCTAYEQKQGDWILHEPNW